MNKERLRLVREALAHTSYDDMAKQWQRFEDEARAESLDFDPQDYAEATFMQANGFMLDEAFTVYVALCMDQGRNPTLPDGTEITVTTAGRQRVASVIEALTA